MPYNVAAHEFLIANGYVHRRIICEEGSGPDFDEYSSSLDWLIIDELGHAAYDSMLD